MTFDLDWFPPKANAWFSWGYRLQHSLSLRLSGDLALLGGQRVSSRRLTVSKAEAVRACRTYSSELKQTWTLNTFLQRRMHLSHGSFLTREIRNSSHSGQLHIFRFCMILTLEHSLVKNWRWHGRSILTFTTTTSWATTVSPQLWNEGAEVFAKAPDAEISVEIGRPVTVTCFCTHANKQASNHVFNNALLQNEICAPTAAPFTPSILHLLVHPEVWFVFYIFLCFPTWWQSKSRPTPCKTRWVFPSWTSQWQIFAGRQWRTCSEISPKLLPLFSVQAWALSVLPHVCIVLTNMKAVDCAYSKDWLDEGTRIYLNEEDPTEQESLEILHTPGHTPDSISLWPGRLASKLTVFSVSHHANTKCRMCAFGAFLEVLASREPFVFGRPHLPRTQPTAHGFVLPKKHGTSWQWHNHSQ